MGVIKRVGGFGKMDFRSGNKEIILRQNDLTKSLDLLYYITEQP